jgi:hypothetical protein
MLTAIRERTRLRLELIRRSADSREKGSGEFLSFGFVPYRDGREAPAFLCIGLCIGLGTPFPI